MKGRDGALPELVHAGLVVVVVWWWLLWLLLLLWWCSALLAAAPPLRPLALRGPIEGATTSRLSRPSACTSPAACLRNEWGGRGRGQSGARGRGFGFGNERESRRDAWETRSSFDAKTV